MIEVDGVKEQQYRISIFELNRPSFDSDFGQVPMLLLDGTGNPEACTKDTLCIPRGLNGAVAPLCRCRRNAVVALGLDGDLGELLGVGFAVLGAELIFAEQVAGMAAPRPPGVRLVDAALALAVLRGGWVADDPGPAREKSQGSPSR